jgi:hypothetical protein
MKPSELDALVSEEVMGISLHRPSRAMIEVGRGHVTCTGSEFALTTGDQLLMPKGNDLPDPEDSRDWNDRYFHYVGEWLSRKYPYIAQEIKDWRMRPKHYSTDIVVAWEVVEHCRTQWLKLNPHETCFWQFVDCARHGWRVDIMWAHHDGDQCIVWASAVTLPEAICKAALKCGWTEREIPDGAE